MFISFPVNGVCYVLSRNELNGCTILLLFFVIRLKIMYNYYTTLFTCSIYMRKGIHYDFLLIFKLQKKLRRFERPSASLQPHFPILPIENWLNCPSCCFQKLKQVISNFAITNMLPKPNHRKTRRLYSATWSDF